MKCEYQEVQDEVGNFTEGSIKSKGSVLQNVFLFFIWIRVKSPVEAIQCTSSINENMHWSGTYPVLLKKIPTNAHILFIKQKGIHPKNNPN